MKITSVECYLGKFITIKINTLDSRNICRCRHEIYNGI